MSPHQKKHLRALSVLSALTIAGLFWAKHASGDEDPAKGILEGLNLTEVVGLRLTATSRHLELVKDQNGWRIVGPKGGQADSILVADSLEALASIVAEPIHDMKPEAANIGVFRMDVELAQGEPIALLFGRPSPVGPGQYVALDGVVHLTRTALPSVLVATDTEFRTDRPVFASISDIGGVDISGKPIPRDHLQALVEDLVDLRIESFKPSPPPSTPVSEIVLRDLNDEPMQTFRLAVGNPWLIKTDDHWLIIGDGLHSWAKQNSGWFQLSQTFISTDETEPPQ